MKIFARSLSLTLALSLVACGRPHHCPEGSQPGTKARETRGPGVPDTVRRAQEEGAPQNTVSPHEAASGRDEELRSWVARKMWATPLGHMYSEYLFADASPVDNLRKVNAIVDRLFSSVLFSMNRVSGLQLMTEDLYNSGKVTPVVNDRIGLLMLNLSLRRHALEVEAAREMGWQLPAIAIVGFLAGSKLVRAQARNITSGVKHGALWLVTFGSRTEATLARRAVSKIDFRGLVTSNFFDDYSIPKALLTGAGAFGLYAPYYFGVKTGNADSTSPTEKTVIYNLEQLIDLSNM